MQGTLTRGPSEWPLPQTLQPTDAAGPCDSLPAFAQRGPNCHVQLPPKMLGNLEGPGRFPSRLHQPELLQQCSATSLQDIWAPATLEQSSISQEADDSRAVVPGAAAQKADATRVGNIAQQPQLVAPTGSSMPGAATAAAVPLGAARAALQSWNCDNESPAGHEQHGDTQQPLPDALALSSRHESHGEAGLSKLDAIPDEPMLLAILGDGTQICAAGVRALLLQNLCLSALTCHQSLTSWGILLAFVPVSYLTEY